MRRGAENFAIVTVGDEVSQLLSMPDDEKRQFCIDLLDEFDAQNITEQGDELLHSCCLPFGFHRNGDRNPSAGLNWRKLTYKCHGCGEGGGIAWFITACRGGDYEETKRYLAKQTATDSTESLSRLHKFFDSALEVRDLTRTEMPKYDTSIFAQLDYEHPYLTKQRGIRSENLRLLQVGYNASSGRIILPHYWHGELVGWQTRMVLDDGGPKYKNTPAFPKNETLYHAPDGIRPITVVESVMSVVSKVHLCPDMVATFGASVTDRQRHLLAGYPRVTLWFDNDPAGWKATLEVGEFLLRYTDVFVVDSPWDADPADLDDETFSTTLANVVPFSLWQQPTQLKEAPHGNP